ncbi:MULTISPECIES: toxic anion resistance protein [unclassified Acinetobacter]|uniref:toxic anion resistance protein n=1 Tax=unclassified Acinetobacter TaxID=196816 RepID=UPI0035B81369
MPTANKQADQTDLSHQFQEMDLAGHGIEQDDYAQVLEIYALLDDDNALSVAEYGKDIRQGTAQHTDSLLDLVKAKDLDETGKKLNDILNLAKQINAENIIQVSEQKSGLFGGLFAKIKQTKHNMQQQFHTVQQQLEALLNEVDLSQQGLKSRVDLLESMYNDVQAEHHRLGLYVVAGQLKQQQISQNMQKLTLQQSGEPNNQQLVQQIYESNQRTNHLEKRVHDLQVLQQSALQTLPMIRMIQSNNLMLIDKFYAIKNITFPAWKNQISLALSLNEQQKSVQLAQQIDDATNEILKRNADLLYQNSVNTAKANQRAVIDIQTLEHVQNRLFSTVNDVMQIQQQGMQQRQQAEQQLHGLQQQLNRLVVEQKPQASKIKG